MYADRYTKPAGLRPGSLGLALLVNVAILGTLIFFSAPRVVAIAERGFVLQDFRDPPIPPVEQKPIKKPEIPSTQPVQREAVESTPTTVMTTPGTDVVDLAPTPPAPIDGIGITGVKVDPIKLPPVMVDPMIDSHYAGVFQPTYPADERRAGHEGKVMVRVLIGVDGRVKQVEKLAASSDSFFEVTRRRALEKWRFKPGTKDGVPVEAWRSMSVTFVLNDA